MKKLSEKYRKGLRKIFRGLGLGAAAFIFQACYGMPPDWGDDIIIIGNVRSRDTDSLIPEIEVSVQAKTVITEKTNKDGYFNLRVPGQDYYTIQFKDTDGYENGGYFKTEKITITCQETSSFLKVFLDLADE